MKPSSLLGAAAALITLPCASAWGGFGHITIAHLAQNLVAPHTEAYFQAVLHNSSATYLAGVATWADSIRYTKWGRFSEPFHYIDAKDAPPGACGVEMDRDCKPQGCVVTAIANYTARVRDEALPWWERAQAAKFVVHLVGDVHQPLHDEDVSRGGNGIHVLWYGKELNLHHVWDSSIAEKMAGGVRRRPYAEAKAWADKLAHEIASGKFRAVSPGWAADIDFNDPIATALAWAREGNAYVCSTVMPDGPEAIAGEELGSSAYYETAAAVVEIQVARAGYRLAAWLDLIAAQAAVVVAADDELAETPMGDL